MPWLTCAQYKPALLCEDNGAQIVLVISGESPINSEVPLRAGVADNRLKEKGISLIWSILGQSGLDVAHDV